MGEGSMPCVSLYSSVDRAKRKRALTTIFKELKSTTFRERRAIIKELYFWLSAFVQMSRGRGSTVKRLNKWTADVRGHSGKLADLLNSMPADVIAPLGCPRIFSPKTLPDFVSQLRKMEEATKRKFSSPSGRKESPFTLASSALVGGLSEAYVKATGKQGRAGRVNNHYGAASRQGKPDGPFFRFITAALALVGDKQGDEAILRAIQEAAAETKIEELTEEVNEAIAEDLRAVFEAPRENLDAFRKALEDHARRRQKLIENAKAREKPLVKRLRSYRRTRLTTHSIN